MNKTPGPAMNRDPQCFACQRRLSPSGALWTAWTSEPVSVHVGAECWKKIAAAGVAGWQPPKGGPRLFQVPPGTNRTHEAAYLSKGEKALIVRSLKFFIHDHQVMIQVAHEKYKKRDPAIFADHKQHHEKQINAADDLLDRFGDRSIGTNPDEQPPKG